MTLKELLKVVDTNQVVLIDGFEKVGKRKTITYSLTVKSYFAKQGLIEVDGCLEESYLLKRMLSSEVWFISNYTGTDQLLVCVNL